jgi:hypothetical protein
MSNIWALALDPQAMGLGLGQQLESEIQYYHDKSYIEYQVPVGYIQKKATFPLGRLVVLIKNSVLLQNKQYSQ